MLQVLFIHHHHHLHIHRLLLHLQIPCKLHLKILHNLTMMMTMLMMEGIHLPIDPWTDYTIDPPANNDPDLYPAKPSPPGYNASHQELIARAAQYHGVALHKESLGEDLLFETLGSTHRSPQTLPMLKGMMRHTR